MRNTYSYLAFKELQWARAFLICLLAISLLSHIIAHGFLNNFFVSNTVFSLMDLFAIYWVAYRGILQRNVISVLTQEWDSEVLPDKPVDQKQSQDINSLRLEELMAKIDDFMAASECFTDPNLTIVDLAEGIKVHPRLISTAINSQSKQNFNSYVNRLRIKKAEKLLKEQKEANWSMEGIGAEVRFQEQERLLLRFQKADWNHPYPIQGTVRII